MPPPTNEVTQLLNAWCKGDQSALEKLVPVVESELPRLARGYLLKNPRATPSSLQTWSMKPICV
jgi:hypothetical protein